MQEDVMRAKNVFVLVLLGLCSIFTACGKKDSGASTGPEGITGPLSGLKIGVSTSYLEDEFTMVMNMKGIVDYAKQLGADISIQNSKSDAEVQTRQIEAFIQDKVDYMFVNPPTLDSNVTAVEEAAAAGIQMICFDGGVNTDKGVLTHIAAQDYDQGKMVGEWAVDYIKKNLNGKATILFESWMALERIQARVDGAHDVLKDSGLDLNFIELDSKGSRETAANVTANYSGDYDLVICSDQNTAQGVISTLQAQNNKNAKVLNVSDWGSEGFAMIRDGNPYYIMACTRSPLQTGRMAVEALVAHLNGEKLERYTYVPGQIITKENVEQFWDFANDTEKE
jgi:inositol transport system substrate-binding protein